MECTQEAAPLRSVYATLELEMFEEVVASLHHATGRVLVNDRMRAKSAWAPGTVGGTRGLRNHGYGSHESCDSP